MKCYHHPSQDAVAKCEGPSCGKHLCRDCYDTWKVDAGPWAGDPLCYDCATAMVAFNAKDVASFRGKVKREWIFIAIGTFIGLMFGAGSGEPMGWWMGLGIGANLGLIAKALFRAAFKDAEGESIWVAIFFGVLGAFLGPIIPAYRILKRVRQTKQLDEIVASEVESLRLMEDYFQYTLAMENADAGKGFESLTAEGGELFNNTYAKNVKAKGEKAAQAQLRQSVVQIAANGEIIRKAS